MNELVISVPVVAVRDMTVPPDNRNPLPRFRVSGGPFGTPREFATREYKTALRELASDPAEPAEIASIKLNLGYYGSYGESLISQGICPRLSKEWSQKACANQLRKELKYLPTDIYLSTSFGLSKFRNHSFSGVRDISVFHLLEDMDPIAPTAKMACADGQTLCYAEMLASDGLFAVWSSSCSKSRVTHAKTKLRRKVLQFDNSSAMIFA